MVYSFIVDFKEVNVADIDTLPMLTYLQTELQCQLRHERLNREERVCCLAVGQGSLGAGEALCALSQSSANIFETDFSTQVNDLPDEVRNFRTSTHCDSPSAAETPRSPTPVYDVSFM